MNQDTKHYYYLGSIDISEPTNIELIHLDGTAISGSILISPFNRPFRRSYAPEHNIKDFVGKILVKLMGKILPLERRATPSSVPDNSQRVEVKRGRIKIKGINGDVNIVVIEHNTYVDVIMQTSEEIEDINDEDG